MNRYPLWKYLTILVVVLLGLVYTLPNLFGEAPAVQVSSAKATLKIDSSMSGRMEQILQKAGIAHRGVFYEFNGTTGTVRARFADVDTQSKAKDAVERELNPDPKEPAYTVALNLLPNSPQWLTRIHALPMYLGLDLRGGVHFLLQVDMRAAINKRITALVGDIRRELRDKDIRASVVRQGNTVEVSFRDAAARTNARAVLNERLPDFTFTEQDEGSEPKLVAALKPQAIADVQNNAIKQNITSLHNRVNELGVAEPVIQQQGPDRIVVQLPGVQDVGRAKEIIGRTATLEVRLADDTPEGQAAAVSSGPVPFGSEVFKQGRGAPVTLKKEPIVTGDAVTGAGAGFDQYNQPSVNVNLDSKGGRLMREATRDRIGKPMAIVLFEKGKGEVLTVATIRDELGERFQITGMVTPEASNDLALLLRAGSLAAPMEIIEERTIGPSLGAENIKKGYESVLYGFCAIAVFMVLYYGLFGLFSVIALAVNLLLLVALLSLLQATLTLPGMAAIALVLGMAIDANVLINERVREELRNGAPPQQAISQGFERAWATILDSNVTTLIAGVALFAFGSGPVKGFAVVHCLGILTSMFSAMLVARALVNLWYGNRKKLGSVSIGQVWRPEGSASKTSTDNA
jgi:preprotein translocase subunit SecD